MIRRPFDDIGPEDIQALIDDDVPESRTLDYKKELPTTREKVPKVDFLKDVSALANTDGGDIVYGVAEKQDQGKPAGRPEAIVGLAAFNFDADTRRLSDVIRTGLTPRLAGCRFKQIDCPSGPVLLLRVGRSFVRPHVVRHDEDRYWGRGPMSNYVLDVDELRRLFLGSAELPEKVRRFRDDRLNAMTTAITGVRLFPGQWLILHIVPLRSLDLGLTVDIHAVAQQPDKLPPIGGRSCAGRYNLDGYIRYADYDQEGQAYSYTQLFRNGVIESAASWQSSEILPALEMAADLFACAPSYFSLLNSLECLPPYVVLLSVKGVKGTYIRGHSRMPAQMFPRVDQELLRLPEVLLNDMPPSVPDALKSAFDALWQAAGQKEAPPATTK